jgi:hypothetical protein
MRRGAEAEDTNTAQNTARLNKKYNYTVPPLPPPPTLDLDLVAGCRMGLGIL